MPRFCLRIFTTPCATILSIPEITEIKMLFAQQELFAKKISIDRQMDGRTDIQTGGETDRYTDRQAGRQTDRLIDR